MYAQYPTIQIHTYTEEEEEEEGIRKTRAK